MEGTIFILTYLFVWSVAWPESFGYWLSRIRQGYSCKSPEQLDELERKRKRKG